MVANLRARAAIALVVFSGLRLGVLGNYKGTDGLRIGDIPELRIGPRGVEFVNNPAMIVVGAQLSKAGHQYFSFLGGEGCGYLADYLNSRIRKGERLTPASPVIRRRSGSVHGSVLGDTSGGVSGSSSYGGIDAGSGDSGFTGVTDSATTGFHRTAGISRLIRDAVRLAGFSWRPYVFRHYFDTCMLMAEAAGILPEDYRVFWMGHG